MIQHTSYTFKKSAFEKIQHLELTEQGLIIKQENRANVYIRYSDITSVQLCYAPYRYRNNNYNCRIKCGTAVFIIHSTSYESFASFNDHANTYTPFMKELIRMVRENNPNAHIQLGQTSSTFLANLALYVFILLVLLGLFYFIPVEGSMSLLIKLAIIASYCYYVMKSFKKNKPKQFTGNEIPTDVLPSF